MIAVTSETVESALEKMGFSLPEAALPAANYVPYIKNGNLVYVSGQLPLLDGKVRVRGKLGEEVSLEEGYKAAQYCALNIFAQLKVACGGDLGRVVRFVKLGGFVSSIASFIDQPKVIDGASDLVASALGGDRGRHARFAVGVSVLPLDVAVEVEAIVEVEPFE